MSHARVTKVRHIGVAVPNFDDAVNFYADAWGLKKTDQDTGIAFFAAEGAPDQYILRIRKADEKRVDLVAFGVDDAAAVDEMATDLAASGVRFALEPDTLRTPGGGYGFRFFDPDGRVVEISSGVEERPFREIAEREAIPVKLSHIVVLSANYEQTKTFYEEKLGFRLSDVILGGLCFMRCTPDHHTFALAPSKRSKLHHVAFEMSSTDATMRAAGRALKMGTPLQRGPVRNWFGDNVSSYYYDPNGNVSEFTSDIEQIDYDGGRVARIITREQNIEQWGVARKPDPEPILALTPEAGYWEAPPI